MCLEMLVEYKKYTTPTSASSDGATERVTQVGFLQFCTALVSKYPDVAGQMPLPQSIRAEAPCRLCLANM